MGGNRAGGTALRALIATARKGEAARPCERFAAGPVSKDRMKTVYEESRTIVETLSSDPGNDALLPSKILFHAELALARSKRRTRDDFAFVTRLRWAEQWIEVGLLSPAGERSPAFRRALEMFEEAGEIFNGKTSPGCAPPRAEIPPLASDTPS